MNLIDTVQNSDIEKRTDRIYGVAVGIITNNEDPEEMGRVKVHLPWLSDENESAWARVAVLMAGKNRGTWFPPQIDDEVLLAFEHGDINRPIVIGAMWNGKDVPPSTSSEIIVIQDKGGSSIKFKPNGDLSIKANGDLNVEANGQIMIKGKMIDLNP